METEKTAHGLEKIARKLREQLMELRKSNHMKTERIAHGVEKIT
jgi:translation elongation factor EF-1beta